MKCPKCNSSDFLFKEEIITVSLNKNYNYNFELKTSQLLDGSLLNYNSDVILHQVERIYKDYMNEVIGVNDLEALYEPDSTRPEELNDIHLICKNCNNTYISQRKFSFFASLYFTFLEREDVELNNILKNEFSLSVDEILETINENKFTRLGKDDIKRGIIESLWSIDNNKYLKIKKLSDAMQVLPPNYGGDDCGVHLIIWAVSTGIITNFIYDLMKIGLNKILSKTTEKDKDVIKDSISHQKNCNGENLYFECHTKDELISIYKADPETLTYEEQIAAIERFSLEKAVQIREGLIELIANKNR